MRIDQALHFLQSAQHPNGHWEDFFVAGLSTEWVTGYIGAALAPIDIDAAKRAWEYLEASFRYGWGYGPTVPRDADSTVWGLKLAAAVGQGNSATATAARRYLRTYETKEGGLTTYNSPVIIQSYVGANWYDPFDGWCGMTHTCVTSAGVPFLPNALDYLQAAQEANGSWVGYWWQDPMYTTALAAEALIDAAPAQVNKAIDWGLQRVRKSVDRLSPFVMAWCLRLLHLAPQRCAMEIETMLDSLSQSQLEDGSWPISSLMRIPMPYDKSPESLLIGYSRVGKKAVWRLIFEAFLRQLRYLMRFIALMRCKF